MKHRSIFLVPMIAVIAAVGMANAQTASTQTKTYSVGFGDLMGTYWNGEEERLLKATLRKPKAAHYNTYWNSAARTSHIEIPMFDGALGRLEKVSLSWSADYVISDAVEVTDTSPRTTYASNGTRYSQVLDGFAHTDTFNTVRFDIRSVTRNGSTEARAFFKDFYEVQNPAHARAPVKNKVVINRFSNPYTTYSWVNGQEDPAWANQKAPYQCRYQAAYEDGGARFSHGGTYPSPQSGSANRGLTFCSRTVYPQNNYVAIQQTMLPGGSLSRGQSISSRPGVRPNRMYGPFDTNDFVCAAGDTCQMNASVQNYLQSTIWCGNANEPDAKDECEQLVESEMWSGKLVVTYEYTPTRSAEAATDSCATIAGCKSHASVPTQVMYRQYDGVTDAVVSRGIPNDLFGSASPQQAFDVTLTDANGDETRECWELAEDSTVTILATDGSERLLSWQESGSANRFLAVTNARSAGEYNHSVSGMRNGRNIHGEMIRHHQRRGTTDSYSFWGWEVAASCDGWDGSVPTPSPRVPRQTTRRRPVEN